MTRTLLAATSANYKEEIGSDHRLTPWLVRRGVWLHARFSVRDSGRAPHEELKAVRYTSQLVVFAEVVWAHKGREKHKTDLEWIKGVWVGRDSQSDAHLVLTKDGVCRCRSIRRCPTEEQFDSSVLQQVKGLPWDAAGETQSWGAKKQVPHTELSHFIADAGATPGCPGCLGKRGARHTVQCERRRAEWRHRGAEREQDAGEAKEQEAGEEQSGADAPGTANADEEDKGATEGRTEEEEFHPEARSSGSGGAAMDDERIDTPRGRDKRVLSDAEAGEQGDVVRRRMKGKQKRERTSSPVQTEKKARSSVEYVATIGANHPTTDEIWNETQPPEDKEKADEEMFPTVCLEELSAEEVSKEARRLGVETAEMEKGIFEELARWTEFGAKRDVPESAAKGYKVLDAALVTKIKGDSSVKARICAKEFADHKRTDVFNATPGDTATKIFLARQAKMQKEVLVIDIVSAFLHAGLKEDEKIFLRPPRVCREPGVLWELQKAVYGLRRSPRDFGEFLVQVLAGLGYRRMKSNPCYFKRNGSETLVHIDDGMIGGDREDIEEILAKMREKVCVKVKGYLNEKTEIEFLGKLYRKKYNQDGTFGYECRMKPETLDGILTDLGLDETARAVTPSTTAMKPSSEFEKEMWDEPLDKESHYQYRRIVGKMRYGLAERQDVQNALLVASRRLATPRLQDWLRLKRLGRYLAATAGTVTEIRVDSEKTRAKETEIKVWTDTDFAGDAETRRSVISVVLQIDGATVHTHVRMQNVTATSSAESEFYGIGSGLVEGLGARSLVEELDGTAPTVKLLMDSDAARAIADRRGPGKLKHMAVRHFWVQEVVSSGLATLRRTSSEENLADLGTKTLTRERIEKLSEKIGIKIWSKEKETKKEVNVLFLCARRKKENTTDDKENDENEEKTNDTEAQKRDASTQTEFAAAGEVYITQNGNCYHMDRACWGLRHAREVQARRACTMCVSRSAGRG